MKDLSGVYKEVLAYPKSLEMRVFPAAAMVRSKSEVIVWDEQNSDWR